MIHINYERIQIVSCDDYGKLVYNSNGLKSVLDKIPDIPIVIFSVAGKCGIGKSFLLNALIPVLEYYRDNGTLNEFTKNNLDFRVHGINGFNYTTRHVLAIGIYLLNTPFIIPNPNDPTTDIAVLLMHCSGLDALDIKGGVDQVLFTLTNFLSSHIMYNVCGNIEPNKLLNLITLASHSTNHREDIFCSLDIIVRDYKFVKHDIEKMRKESENYSSKLSTCSGSIVESNIRKIKQYFSFIECYPLPYPGRNVELSTFNGETNMINSKFIDLFFDYIFKLFYNNRIVPKFENREELLKKFDIIRNMF